MRGQGLRSRAVPISILLLAGAALASGCGAHVGYALNPASVRPGRTQPIRLAVANLVNASDRPEEEENREELVRLVGPDEAKGRTSDEDFGGKVNARISDMVAKHLAFAGCFAAVGRVDLDSDEQVEYLKDDIKKLSGTYDAILIGRISHFYGLDSRTGENNRRSTEARVHLTDLKIIRTRDLRMIWSGQAIAQFRQEDSDRPGNKYRMANDALRDALNHLVVDLSRQRLTLR